MAATAAAADAAGKRPPSFALGTPGATWARPPFPKAPDARLPPLSRNFFCELVNL